MRVFLAVPCGEAFRTRLSTALDSLRDLPGVRWSPSYQYHQTLSFLGEWPENRVQGLQVALEGLSWPEAFRLQEPGWGGFPDLRAPRVLFVQWRDDAPLNSLAAQVRARVQESWPDSPADEKPFRGHLTVARVKNRLGPDAQVRVQGFTLPALPAVQVREVQLVRSELRKTGAVHTILSRYLLSGKDL